MRAVVFAILVLLMLALVLPGQHRQEGFQETIFISIGSYRDRECLQTVREAFGKASSPGRVFVGLCQQNKEDAESCTAGLEVDMTHVRQVEMPHLDAKGPTYARALCASLFGGQDYFLQIDSHTRFAQGWDDSLIASLNRCPTRKAVLTHYPHAFDATADELERLVPVMCRSKWNDDGLPTFEAIMKPVGSAGLRRVPFCAGGMLFTRGQMLSEVPMDPGLAYLFQGEEVLLSARLFTHGWDLFTPDVNAVTHHYERTEGPRFWDDLKGYRGSQKQSIQRVRQLLGLEQPSLADDPYGMGSVRSMEQWWAFCKLDPGKRQSSSEAAFCGD